MSPSPMLQFRVAVSKDPETGYVVAEVPALGIADQGTEVPESLANIKAVVTLQKRESQPPWPTWRTNCTTVGTGGSSASSDWG